jgi:hypothetical protein
LYYEVQSILFSRTRHFVTIKNNGLNLYFFIKYFLIKHSNMINEVMDYFCYFKALFLNYLLRLCYQWNNSNIFVWICGKRLIYSFLYCGVIIAISIFLKESVVLNIIQALVYSWSYSLYNNLIYKFYTNKYVLIES